MVLARSVLTFMIYLIPIVLPHRLTVLTALGPRILVSTEEFPVVDPEEAQDLVPQDFHDGPPFQSRRDT